MTEAAPAARALYLQAAGAATCFAVLHDAAPRGDTAVLLVPPFGWDDVASYRSRRAWAEHLAASGRPALRIDLPGTGDSAGGPDEPALPDQWIDAVAGAAGWLRETTGCPRIAVVGLGLGGLLTLAAVARGAQVDEVVLWGAPGRGRALVRELRAFARLDASGATEQDPERGLVANGHALRPETLDALGRLDAAALELPAGLRALVLDRDGIAPDTKLVESLRAVEAAVDVEPGEGWGGMLDRPQAAVPPTAAFARVDRWLDAGEGSAKGQVATAAPPPPASAHDTLTVEVDGQELTEEPVAIAGEAGTTFGILTRPVGTERDLTLVLLNAGAIRRIGPNRMYVELARRWAARGVPSLRLDVDGVGDAEGDGSRYADDASFHLDFLTQEVREALDALDARGLPSRAALLGLCSGAHWAFQTALQDDRVAGAILLNARALFWEHDLGAARELTYYLERARSPETWRRALRGDLSLAYPLRRAPAMLRRALRVVIGLPARIAARLRPRRASTAGPASGDGAAPHTAADPIAAAFATLSSRGVRTVLAFAAGEPVHEELARDGYLARLAEWPGVEVRRIGGDVEAHTLAPPALQREAHALVDEVLAPLAQEPAGDLARQP